MFEGLNTELVLRTFLGITNQEIETGPLDLLFIHGPHMYTKSTYTGIYTNYINCK